MLISMERQEMQLAVRKVVLGFIEKLDHGFETKIGQDGENFPGGEETKMAVFIKNMKTRHFTMWTRLQEGFDAESNEALLVRLYM